MFNEEITIAVLTSSNNPNYEDCLKALKNQTMTGKLEIIKNAYPISKAFQEMFDHCSTKYVIQIDEDFVLYPNAIQSLYNTIKNAPNNIAMVCYELHDVHLGFDMYGIKIFDCDIYKKFPLPQGTYSGSLNQIDQIKQAGWTYIAKKIILGLHSPKWTNELIYARYYDLMDKYRARKYQWMGELPLKIYSMFQKDPSDLNFYALMGCLNNLMYNNKNPKEKDFSTKNKEYMKLTNLLSQPTSATLSMSSNCNFKCKFCYRQSNTVEQSVDMSVNKIKELLTVFPAISGLCLCGMGEPLLNKNLEEILCYLKEINMNTGLITNGSLLKEKFNIIQSCSPGYISISLNAPNQELHKKISGKEGLFPIILEGIQLCANAKIRTYLTYVCDRNNLEYIPDFLKLAKELKVSGVHLFNTLPHHLINNTNKDVFLKLVLTEEDKFLIDTLRSLPDSDIVLSYPALINLKEPLRNCKFAWQKLTMNGAGAISICNSIFPPHSSHGNIRDSLVWTNSYCTNFRNNFAEELPLACSLCFRNYVLER